MTVKISSIDKNALRRRAEQRILGRSVPAVPPPDIARLCHELQVHQVELEIQNDELRHANAELQSMCAEKQGLYQALLHELVQPVQALHLFLDVLGRTPLTAEQTQLLSQLARGIDKLGELSRDLSDLGQVGAEGIEAPAVVALGPLLERTLEDYAPMAAQLDLVLRLVPSSVNVETAPSLLGRIVGNVLANAIRRADSPSLLLGVRELGRDAVRIEIWSDDATAAANSLPPTDATDPGCGTAERNPFSGEGLELLIAERLAEALGVKLAVSSIKGTDTGGSLYSLTLPRRFRRNARRSG